MVKRANGFTIVELLIVIVVIAVLAGLSYVGYTSISNRAYDSRVASAVAEFEKALRLWSAETGITKPLGNHISTVPISGLNCEDGSGSGFVGTESYVCTTEDILRHNGYLPESFTSKLPGNAYFYPLQGGARSIMMYSCAEIPGRYLLYWTLRQPSASDTENLYSTMSSCGYSDPPTHQIVANWGMRAVKIVQL